MRTWIAAAAVLAVSVAGVQLAVRDDEPGPPAGAAAPAPAADQPLDQPTDQSLDHEDDYTAPAEELVEHADHLDFDRLPPDTRREIEAELARREAASSSLWQVYGPALFDDDGVAVPARFGGLAAYELAYVLMALRAEQVAGAVATAGGIEQARAQIGPEHPEVTVTLTGDCVTAAWAGDPFGRAFGARVAPRARGTDQERVERSVRVGLAGESACDGEPVALSPAASTALSAPA